MSATVPEIPAQNNDISRASSDSEAGGLAFIEQLAADGCQTPRRPLLRGVNSMTRNAVLFRPRCKSWKCAYCGEINRKLWAYKAQHGASVLQQQNPDIPLQMVCLTSHEKLSPSASISVLPRAWDKIRKRAGRASGLELVYFAVPERHKSGKLHLHGIFRTDLSERWWKDVPRACGMGYMNDADDLAGAASAALYVSKYLGKTLAEESWPKYHQRVRKSNNWPALPELEKPDGWQFEIVPKEIPVGAAYIWLVRQGYRVAVAGHEHAWEYVENPDAAIERIKNA